MRKIVLKINNVFIAIVLLFFYFAVIGFAGLVYRLFIQPEKKGSTYWVDPDDKKPTINYFQSSY